MLRFAWIINTVFFFFGAVSAQASLELDRRYHLENIGYLRSWDNIEGLFGEYVDVAYKEYFSKQQRFNVKDLKHADSVLEKSSISYQKLLDDRDILAQVAKQFRLNSMIRTKITQEGPTYRLVIDWMAAPQMDLLATESVVIRDASELRVTLTKTLDELLHRIPFKGQVTGRDGASVTANLTYPKLVNPGDFLEVGTVEEVQVHPLLRAIVDWKMTPTGRLRVLSTDEAFVFTQVVEEVEGQTIQKDQKILRVIPGPKKLSPEIAKKQSWGEPTTMPEDTIVQESTKTEVWQPRLGWVSGGLGAGLMGRQSSPADPDYTGKQGSGLLFQGRVAGELWVTQSWTVSVAAAMGFASYSQTDLVSGATTSTGTSSSTGSSSVATTVQQLRMAGGYRFQSLAGFEGGINAGFRNNSWALPADGEGRMGTVQVKGPFVGLGVEFKIREKWALLLGTDVGVLTTATELGFRSAGTLQSASDVQALVGATYQWKERIRLRGVADFTVNSVAFSSGDTVVQQALVIYPSVQIFF